MELMRPLTPSGKNQPLPSLEPPTRMFSTCSESEQEGEGEAGRAGSGQARIEWAAGHGGVTDLLPSLAPADLWKGRHCSHRLRRQPASQLAAQAAEPHTC